MSSSKQQLMIWNFSERLSQMVKCDVSCKIHKEITILNVEVANATKGHKIPQDLSKQKVVLKYFFQFAGHCAS
jgi:hypothetical protein